MVIDTCLTVGVSPLAQFIAEDQFARWLRDGSIDMQIVFQPDESFHHETPDWNPYLGNDYVAKVQRGFRDQVLGLASVKLWHQARRSPGSLVNESPALDELDWCILDLGPHGLRMNPIQHNYQFNNAMVVWPVLTRLSDLQRRVGRRLIVNVHAYGDSLSNSPEALAETAAQFPDLLFLVEHSGFVWGLYALYGPGKFCPGPE